jgi:hypothetical protein
VQSGLRKEKARKLDAGVVGKDGQRIRFLSRRKLATEYAMERIEATRKSKGSGLPAAIAYSLLQKFQASTAEYIRGKRKRPRFKARLDGISLQAQLQATAPWPLSHDRQGKTFVDLARIAGEMCEKVAVVFHRDVPAGAKIKQVAVTVRRERMYAVLMIEAPATVLVKEFPDAGGRLAGIDPGRKVGCHWARQPAIRMKWFNRRWQEMPASSEDCAAYSVRPIVNGELEIRIVTTRRVVG